MTEAIAYECPYCHATVEVENHELGDRVDCDACSRPFKAALPVGRPVDDDEPAEATPIATGSDRGGERTLYEAHPAVWRAHPFRTFLLAVLAIAGIAAVAAGLSGQAVANLSTGGLAIAGLIALGIVAVAVGYLFLLAKATVMTITNRRTIIRRGLISQNTNEVQHDDVRNIRCNRSLMERMLDYGDIELSSAGQNDMEVVIHDIPRPLEALEIIRRFQ